MLIKYTLILTGMFNYCPRNTYEFMLAVADRNTSNISRPCERFKKSTISLLSSECFWSRCLVES